MNNNPLFLISELLFNKYKLPPKTILTMYKYKKLFKKYFRFLYLKVTLIISILTITL